MKEDGRRGRWAGYGRGLAGLEVTRVGRVVLKRVGVDGVPPVEVITREALPETVKLGVKGVAVAGVRSRWLWEGYKSRLLLLRCGDGCVPVDEVWVELLRQSHWRK